jgi:hypothetical protein
MLGHQLGQDPVLGLDLLLQVGDALLISGVVRWRFLLEAAAPFSKNSFCQR